MTTRISASRKALITVMAACVLITHVSAKARVFLLAGQSNMSGAGLYEKLKKSEKKAPEKVKIWNKNQWQDLGPGVAANEGRFGPEIAFGRAMRKAFSDDEIYLIKTAAGGTTMYKHWHFGGRGKGGPFLKRFLATAKAAMKNLDQERIKYTIDGFGFSHKPRGWRIAWPSTLRDWGFQRGPLSPLPPVPPVSKRRPPITRKTWPLRT